jgi:hypothetical protein
MHVLLYSILFHSTTGIIMTYVAAVLKKTPEFCLYGLSAARQRGPGANQINCRAVNRQLPNCGFCRKPISPSFPFVLQSLLPLWVPSLHLTFLFSFGNLPQLKQIDNTFFFPTSAQLITW